MKKILFLITYILIITILITACNKESEMTVSRPVINNQIEELELAKQIDITALYWNEANETQLLNMSDFIKEEYGIDVNISITRDYDLTGGKTANLMRDSENGGLYFFYFANSENIDEMAQAGEILPLNELLSNNETWKELPEGMKSMYASDDGNIYALTRSYSQNVFGRAYKSEYLKEIGETPPNTLVELYTVSKKLAERSLDSIGMLYYNALSFNDIFYANGTPIALSHTGINTTSIVYDSETNSYEDSMLKEDMNQSLAFIRTLFVEKITGTTGGRGNRGNHSVGVLASDEKYSSMYGLIPDNYFTSESYEISYGVRGSVYENINPLSYNYTNGYYVLASNTPQAKEVINSFVSVFYGDVKGYVAATYGAPDDSYQFNGDNVLINDASFFNRNDFPVVVTNPLLNFATIAFSASGDVAKQLTMYGQGLVAKTLYINNGLTSKQMFSLSSSQAYPEVFPSKDDYALSNPGAQLLDGVLDNIFRGFSSVEEGLAEYKEIMKQLGQQEVNDKLNEQLGSLTKYKY